MLGICGGYQMLGATVSDPEGIEGPPAIIEGLGCRGRDHDAGREGAIRGGGRLAEGGAVQRATRYARRRHVGPGCKRPLLNIAGGRPDGAVLATGASPAAMSMGFSPTTAIALAAWLARIGADSSALDYEGGVEATLDALADHLERHIDCRAHRGYEIARAPDVNFARGLMTKARAATATPLATGDAIEAQRGAKYYSGQSARPSPIQWSSTIVHAVGARARSL